MEDLEGLPPFDLMIDCSAEPSVQAGLDGSPRYVLETNLAGSINCLELARARGGASSSSAPAGSTRSPR